MKTVITGTGSFIPANIKPNRDFTRQDFYDEGRKRIPHASEDIIRNFELITGIRERRYASPDMNASDMAVEAARIAIADAGVDPELIDQLIVAHNFGDVAVRTNQSDVVPSIASRVKQRLGISNPGCIPYDLLFGCPGWVQGLIQADAFFKAGLAKKCLVIGTETLSRVIDRYDRDSMLFSDGAGAVILEGLPNPADGAGILGAAMQSYALKEADYIYMGKSNCLDSDPCIRYLKMQGRKVYEFALKTVPEAIKSCLAASKVSIREIKKIFIHQANEKMDAAIVKALYAIFDIQEPPEAIMPMNIRELGNSSVATVPTLFDMVRKGCIPGHALKHGDIIILASVGAGMNINSVCYRY
ncbi:MAG TPA: ketoacyl-ACP synthase III [Puia sp.]|nr:ketoacyl-ACP synthase III [Puia sp.]